MRPVRFILVPAILFVSVPLFADTYTLDKAHSGALFSIRHLVGRVTGKFDDIDATINVDEKGAAASSVEFSAKAASINTGVANRDTDLRSEHFFDVDKNPEITFKSTSIKPSATKDVYEVTGNLTIRGVTKQITLPVTFYGFIKDPRGNEKAGFSTSTTINRKDYGVSWNRSLDAGGVLLGDDVDVTVNIEAYKAKPPAPAPTPPKSN